MAILQAKTPEGLFKQIKPAGLELRASVVDTPYRDPYQTLKRDYLTNHGSYINKNGQLRSKYSLAYNGTGPAAQKRANEEGKVIGTHDPKMKRFLPRANGAYGQVRLPEQWKYKRADQLADKMVSGFEGDPTANMTSDEYREYLMNEKGWDKSAADRQVNLFYPNQPAKVKNWNEKKYNDIVDFISIYRGDGVPMGDIQNQLLEDYGSEYEDLIRYAVSKWAE